MQQLLNYTGNLAGGLGILLCVVAGLTRLFGQYYLGGYAATTIFSVGTGLMVFACLVKLETLAAQSRN
jgi:type IV secretory pathway VirB2 component (pilin)